MSDLPAAALAAVAEVLNVHRWKTMGVASVECECGAILTGDADPFPADEAFRSHIAAEALAAAGPHLAAAERELLDQAENALHSLALRLIGVSPKLSEPFTDQPGHSSWSLTIGPEARRADTLARTIRKHLGLGYRRPERAAGTPPMDGAAERIAALEALADEMLPFVDADQVSANLGAWPDVEQRWRKIRDGGR